ncbi:MAG: dienelactone hydrolase family protein [Alphaproteobacteria bacterium]|nr:dienelactone hydrolase family protein [Alphaproteobacteria bacterium]
MSASVSTIEQRAKKSRKLAEAFEIGVHPLTLSRSESVTNDGYVLETLRFGNAAGESVRGYITRPQGVTSPMPAILYIHAHGGRYEIGADELIAGRPALLSPLGAVFAGEGYLTLTIDLPCFGERQHTSESALSKALLWHNRSLAGQMLGELHSALDYLCTRTDVDAQSIAAFGISMGATFAYWLAAVDPRIAAAAHLCCFADFETMIASGAHDGHGIYLIVPGLLDLASNGEIVGLMAPRPQFVGLGGRDPLTPPDAVEKALAEARAAYEVAGAGDQFEVLIEPEGGHAETPAIRAAVLDFLACNLKAPGF